MLTLLVCSSQTLVLTPFTHQSTGNVNSTGLLLTDPGNDTVHAPKYG